MLLRLFHLSFWLAAAIAALALLAPRVHQTQLTALAGLASVLALGLWCAASRGEERRPLAWRVAVAAAPAIDDGSLADVAALLVRRAQAAGSFEAALHAVAQVLRNELGARDAHVHEVLAVDATEARISDMIESQPGFRTVPRRVHLDASPLAQALRGQVEAGTTPGAVALPVTRDGQVVAAIVLSTLELSFDPSALAGLLALARSTLSERAAGPCAPGLAAPARRPPPAPANGLVVEDNGVRLECASRVLRRRGCRVTVACGMLDRLNLLS